MSKENKCLSTGKNVLWFVIICVIICYNLHVYTIQNKHTSIPNSNNKCLSNVRIPICDGIVFYNYSIFSPWYLQALLTPEDAILSDELNHASIIDGIRLCKANKYRYKHMDMQDLEVKLQETQVSSRVTPRLFSSKDLPKTKAKQNSQNL